MRKLIITFVILTTALILAACGSANMEMDSAPAQAPVMTAAGDAPMMATHSYNAARTTTPGDVDWQDIAESGQRHIIQTADAELETENFAEARDRLRQLAPAANGFIESSAAHGRRQFSIVMRVPAASFDTVLSQVEALAYVRVLNQRAQDVTAQFYDMGASYQLRRVEEERILALIDQAENIQEILALEQRLSSTRQSIEMYLSQLNHMAGQIAYSTISVTLTDISDIPVVIIGPSLGERIGGAFGESVDTTVNVLQNIIVFLAAAIVPLAILGLLAGIVYLIHLAVRVTAAKRKKVGQG